MPVHRLEDLVAFQLSRHFKREVYGLLSLHPGDRDYRYLSQLRGAASSVEANIAEGFYRVTPREFARFLLIARGSLGEAEVRIADGIDRGYFTEADCAGTYSLIKRTGAAIMALRKSVLTQVQ